MPKLARLITKFDGDNVVVTAKRFGARGRQIIHSQERVKLDDLEAFLGDPKNQTTMLMVKPK